MRVIATVTIDGEKETRLEGESPFMSGEPGDQLEQKGLGVWLTDYRINGQRGRAHRGRVFCPWTSVLYVETKSFGD